MLFVRDFLGDQEVRRRPGAPAAPAVSVILPTFQRCAGGLLQKAIDSVLTQSFRDLELIVIDDGSVDGTRDLLQAVQRRDERVVLVRHELNCGLPALRVNEGIELARGRWIAFQFDDDEWLAGGLAALVERGRAAPEPSLVFGRADWVAETWRTELPRAAIDLPLLADHNDIANNSVLVPRRLLELHGLYDPHIAMRRLCDWDLWLRLIGRVPFVAVDRLVARVPFVSDPTALGVTAPADLPVVRYLMSIPRRRVLDLDHWRDYPVDAVQVAGVELPAVFVERLEREQLGPFRARFPRLAAAPPPRAEPGRAPKVLVCIGDEYDRGLGLRLGHYDELYRAGTPYKQVYHALWELDAESRPRVVVDILLCDGTSSAKATGTVTEMLAAGTPVAYHLDDGLRGVLDCDLGLGDRAPGDPARVEIERQIARVDAVWCASPALSEVIRPLNPRLVPHRHALPERWLPAALAARGTSGRLRIGCLAAGLRRDEIAAPWGAIEALGQRWGDRLELEIWGLEADIPAPPGSSAVRRPLPESLPRLAQQLRDGALDVLLAPRRERSPGATAAAPAGYLLAAVAGALGVLAEAPAPAVRRRGVDCLEADDTSASWQAAIEEALTMPMDRFDSIRRRMIERVRSEWTAAAQLPLHEAACRATVLHAMTRDRRVDGRPVILYVFAGDAAPRRHRELLDAAVLVRRYGFAPHALCAADAPGLQEDLAARAIPWRGTGPGLLDPGLLDAGAQTSAAGAALRALIGATPVACVHASAPVPAVATACAALRIVLVEAPPGERAGFESHPGRQASELLALYGAGQSRSGLVEADRRHDGA